MIDFLTSPIANTPAAQPTLWILGITLAAVSVVLLRDAWRWFIALGRPSDEQGEAGDWDLAPEEEGAPDKRATLAPAPMIERRQPNNAPTGFGRRRADAMA